MLLAQFAENDKLSNVTPPESSNTKPSGSIQNDITPKRTQNGIKSRSRNLRFSEDESDSPVVTPFVCSFDEMSSGEPVEPPNPDDFLTESQVSSMHVISIVTIFQQDVHCTPRILGL